MPQSASIRLAAFVVLASCASTASANPEWVYHCMPRDPDNGDFRLEGTRLLVEGPRDQVADLSALTGVSTLTENNGFVRSEHLMLRGSEQNLANRVDIVFVGDGYTTTELGLYAQQVSTFANQIFAPEPLATYRPLFSVHRVDVVSNVSGVSNDPNPGIFRDTPLEMSYWCNDIERLLCVNTFQARLFAGTAPFGFDQVVALANSSKYGGAGYSSSDIGTAAAGNSSAAEIVIHELGHSMGDLADEYTYGGPTNFVGPEPFAANVSLLTEPQMAAMNAKWSRWLGDNSSSFDGRTGTYEGGQYSVNGIYRPTNNSKMRSLFRPFNRVSAEELIKEIYRIVDPIDSFSPATTDLVTGRPQLSVSPVQPINAPLDVEWFVNLQPYSGPLLDDGRTLDTSTLDSTGIVVVSAKVTDNTPMVRDESFRAANMSSEIVWTLELTNPCLADVNMDGDLNGLDFGAWLGAYNAGAPAADQNADGSVNGLDFGAWLANFNAGCD